MRGARLGVNVMLILIPEAMSCLPWCTYRRLVEGERRPEASGFLAEFDPLIPVLLSRNSQSCSKSARYTNYSKPAHHNESR